MGNLLFWLGIGAAQTSAESNEAKPADHRVIIGVAITLLALLMVVRLLNVVGVVVHSGDAIIIQNVSLLFSVKSNNKHVQNVNHRI